MIQGMLSTQLDMNLSPLHHAARPAVTSTMSFLLPARCSGGRLSSCGLASRRRWSWPDEAWSGPAVLCRHVCEDLAVPAGGDLTGGIPSVTLHSENASIRFHLGFLTEHISEKMTSSLGMRQLPFQPLEAEVQYWNVRNTGSSMTRGPELISGFIQALLE